MVFAKVAILTPSLSVGDGILSRLQTMKLETRRAPITCVILDSYTVKAAKSSATAYVLHMYMILAEVDCLFGK